VRVGVDAEPCTRLAGQAGVRVPQVEPVGLRVDLERGPGLGRTLDHPGDVDLRSGAPVELARGWMADAVDVRVVDRREQTLRRRPVEGLVERGDDPVELRE